MMGEVIRAHLVRQRHCAHLSLVEGDHAVVAGAAAVGAGVCIGSATGVRIGATRLQRCGAGGWQPVVEAAR